MTIEEKAKAYDEALERAKKYLGDCMLTRQEYVEKVFPKLKEESEDKRIRKEIIAFLDDVWHLGKNANFDKWCKADCADWIAWLEKQGKNNMGISETTKQKLEDNLNKSLEKETTESWNEFLKKQGEQKETLCDKCKKEQSSHSCQDITALGRCAVEYEQKPADKVEPKFKVGDWIINAQGTLRHIINVDKGGYQTDGGWLSHDTYEKTFHLWTIQDTKAGDILVSNDASYIVLFKGLSNLEDNIDRFKSYCHYYKGIFSPIEDPSWCCKCFHPATKEQCDFLFQTMKKFGYVWDAEKKELTIIPKFKVGDIIRHKEQGCTCKIDAIDTATAEYGVSGCNGTHLPFDFQDAWELVEQNSNEWSEEDEKMINSIAVHLNATTCGFPEDRAWVDRFMNWLNSIKDRVQPQPKQEWNEEDKTTLNSILSCIEYCQNKDIEAQYNGNRYVDPKRYESMSNWLKSLKNRMIPQSKQEWSEEDEAMLENTKEILTRQGFHQIQANWLRSLKNRVQSQSIWKPSEEQMKALEEVYDLYCDVYNFTPPKALIDLYTDLKNLMN